MKERNFTRGAKGNMTVELILEIQDELGTDDNIGKYLGITRQAVYQFRKNNSIPPVKEKHIARNAKIRQLRKGGEKLNYISHKMDMSVSQIGRILSGPDKPQPSYIPEPHRQEVPQGIHQNAVAP